MTGFKKQQYLSRMPKRTYRTVLIAFLFFSSLALSWALPPPKTTSRQAMSSSVNVPTRFHSNGKIRDADETHHINTGYSCRGWHQPRRILRGCISFWLGTALLFSGNAAASDSVPAGQQYWSIMTGLSFTPGERVAANEALLDYAVGTINTQFYDNTGGAFFAPRDFYSQWKMFKRVASGEDVGTIRKGTMPTDVHLDTREGAVQGLKWLVGSLNDPFSKYLTREELNQELHFDSNGFLGTGAVVESPQVYGNHHFSSFFGPPQPPRTSTGSMVLSIVNSGKNHRLKKILTITRAANLPVVTAVAPDSPAERAGIVVGDRIVAVGDQDFIGWTRSQVEKRLLSKYNQEHYFGQADLTVAKPVHAVSALSEADEQLQMASTNGNSLKTEAVPPQEIVLGYRQMRVRLPVGGSSSTAEPIVRLSPSDQTTAVIPDSSIVGGDSIVHYQLLTSSSGSIFDHYHSDEVLPDDYKVGYIRLTRFSKASTAGYVQAVHALEDAGAQSYILDLRNNYGGVIQEAMLTASTLLRDPHAVLCYTMNARGGFTPHDTEEYIVDRRYPGYFLSSESNYATIDQVQKENPAMFEANGIAWDPPSSFASIHEQVTKRGIRRIGYMGDLTEMLDKDPVLKAHYQAQKKIVLLVNEGTASSAEVFAAALHDNARTVALVGTKTYGKGLIQHTFPMPDGGGLRLTVAEYLRPSLSHVTNVGGARFDQRTGDFVGGGIRPDIQCESTQGIPGNIRADLCVGVALDALEEVTEDQDKDSPVTAPATGLFAGIPSQLLGNNRGKVK